MSIKKLTLIKKIYEKKIMDFSFEKKNDIEKPFSVTH